MRGGRESSQSAFCFKLQDSVQEEGGDTREASALMTLQMLPC